MGIIKEFRCAKHGDFEGTHPICPAMGCLSEDVQRVFLTPVSVSQGRYSRFDRGLRQTAERMNISNFKTVREGETAFAGRAPIGQELLWGDDVGKVMGRPFAQQMQAAAAPLHVEGVKPTDPHLTVNNGMRTTATDLGITRSPLPSAELTYDGQGIKAAKGAPA